MRPDQAVLFDGIGEHNDQGVVQITTDDSPARFCADFGTGGIPGSGVNEGVDRCWCWAEGWGWPRCDRGCGRRSRCGAGRNRGQGERGGGRNGGQRRCGAGNWRGQADLCSQDGSCTADTDHDDNANQGYRSAQRITEERERSKAQDGKREGA